MKLTTAQQRDLNTISNRNYTNALRASMTGAYTKRYMQSVKAEYPTIKSLVKKGLVVIKEHDYLYLTPAGIELTMDEYDFEQESQKVQQGIWKTEAYTKFLSIKESAFRNAIQTRLNNNPLPDGMEYEVRFDLHGNYGQDNVISTITVNNTNEWQSKHGGHHTVMIIDICSEGTFELRNLPNRINSDNVNRMMAVINTLTQIGQDTELLAELNGLALGFNDASHKAFEANYIQQQS